MEHLELKGFTDEVSADCKPFGLELIEAANGHFLPYPFGLSEQTDKIQTMQLGYYHCIFTACPVYIVNCQTCYRHPCRLIPN